MVAFRKEEGSDLFPRLGPVDLTQDTVSGIGLVPTVMDNLYETKIIKKEVLGVTFHPSSEYDSDGKLTFGQ